MSMYIAVAQSILGNYNPQLPVRNPYCQNIGATGCYGLTTQPAPLWMTVNNLFKSPDKFDAV